MMESPCAKCERKGCGSYHDICKEYQEYKATNEKNKRKNIPLGREYIKASTYHSRVRKKKMR